MNLLPNNFFSNEIVAGVTDSSMDFASVAQTNRFNKEQSEYLLNNFNIDAAKIANVKQVHGNAVVFAQKKNDEIIEADAIITNVVGLPIVVRTADCMSIFIHDAKHKAIGLVHAGWRGTEQGIAIETLIQMKIEFETNPQDIKVAFGPSICSNHYEVTEEFLDYFPDDIIKKNGKLYFDNRAVTVKQLLNLGVKKENILDSKICTLEDDRCFSHRRQAQKAGRMLCLMMIK